MIAKHNADLLEASETLFTLNADYMIRKQCEARADYYRLHNTLNQKLNILSAEVKSLTQENQEKDLLIQQLKDQLRKYQPPV